MFKKSTPKTFTLTKGDILTPNARQFLKERRITIVEGQVAMPERGHGQANDILCRERVPTEAAFQPRFVSDFDGGRFESKPEYMTQVFGNKLVGKDDPRIMLRGRLDSLQSTVLEIQLQFVGQVSPSLMKSLDEILLLIRATLRAEVMGELLSIELLLGLDDASLREHSHHPQKHYGIPHFVPDVSMGREVVLLNKLRTTIREVEVVATQTFKHQAQVSRIDIIQILNRLSSAAYILMCRVRSGYYKRDF